MGAGGAERVMSVMANYWAEQGKQVTLITMASTGEDFYALHSDIHRVGLGLTGSSFSLAEAIKNNVRRLKRLRQEIRASQPDFVISFVDTMNILTLASTAGLKIPVIVSERIDPRHQPIGLVWAGLRSLLYPFAEALVVQTDAVRDWAKKSVREKAIHIIPNPLQPSLSRSVPPFRRHGGNPTLVAIGRLHRQKGFDLLVRAFAKCVERHASWSLVVLGEGEEREPLEALIAALGLKDKVDLPGRVKDPSHILQQAELFALSSRYEGFPNVLLEAMSYGLAVISTDCASGPGAIIRDGVDGILVPPNDVEAMATGMDRLMADRTERQRLGASAISVIERFGVDKVMSMWDDVFLKVYERQKMTNTNRHIENVRQR